MRNFDQEAKYFRDQLIETTSKLIEDNDVIVHQITIKPKMFSIQFEDEWGEKVKYDLPISETKAKERR